MKENQNLRICLVTVLFHKEFIPPLSNLESILGAIGENDVYAIEGYQNDLETNKKNKIRKFRILHEQKNNFFSRILRFLYFQIRIPLKMIKLSPDIDLYIIFMGELEFLPIITAKLLRKKVLMLMPSSFSIMKKYDNENSNIIKSAQKIIIYLQKLSFYFVDMIILYSNNLIKEWKLEKHANKIQIAHEHTLDFELFQRNGKIHDRENLVGYIGRLSEEKGTLNFVKSINNLIKERNDLRFIIIGNGDLRNNIDAFLEINQLNHYVDIIKWIPHQELPNYFNKLKLLVLPSYTEGLPNVILESMACGTPVLATKVGAISDIIIDEKTGFIIDDNNPNNISYNIIRALEYDNIEEVANNSYNLVKKEFSFEKTVQTWRKIINDIEIE